MPPKLFNLILESIERKANVRDKNIRTNHIQLIAYIDNVTIMANRKAKLLYAIDLSGWLENWEKRKKAKYMG